MMRSYSRTSNDLRPLEMTPHFTCHAEGSCLIKMGQTWVLTTASIEETVPRFMAKQGRGWVTAEYSMLPRSTHQRMQREVSRGKQGGRTMEIQRLIGRSLRACIDPKKLGERTITIDCDVLQADGGTRAAAINGGFVALSLAVKKWMTEGKIKENPIINTVSAISLGLKNNEVLVDLDYIEDSDCDVDMNVVMLGHDQLIEIQGTGENTTYSLDQANQLMQHAQKAIIDIAQQQHRIIETA